KTTIAAIHSYSLAIQRGRIVPATPNTMPDQSRRSRLRPWKKPSGMIKGLLGRVQQFLQLVDCVHQFIGAAEHVRNLKRIAARRDWWNLQHVGQDKLRRPVL